MSILAAALITVVLAIQAVGDDKGVPSRANADEKAVKAILNGLDWLKSQQKEDGSWSNSNYPAMTALGLWAFARSDHPDRDKVCTKAANFVAGFARKDGGIYKLATGGRGSGGLSTYNTAICMTALHTYDRAKYAPLILKAREFMAGSQLQGDSSGAGGFGYERTAKGPRSRADLSNTGVGSDGHEIYPGVRRFETERGSACRRGLVGGTEIY